MNWKQTLSKFMFGGVIFVAIGIASFGFITFQNNLDAMERASQDNILWSSSQLEKELTRFRDALRTNDAGQVISSSEVNLRFDVLWSRVEVFQRGSVGERLREYDREDNVIGRLFDELKKQEARVVSISGSDSETLANIHRAFYPYASELSDLSRRLTIGEEEKAALIRKQIGAGANFALYAGVGSVLLVILAMTYFVWESRSFRALAKYNKVLADKFEQASLSKSRFLTMMSHELRTPMNGVLGLLAVARQSEMDPQQKNLLNQVDRSAVRMLDMLTDILDFAALENADTDFADKPFFTEELALALPDLLGPVAEQANVQLKVTRDKALPIMLSGDATRLRRSYALMATYFLETAGAQEISIHISYTNGHLLAKIMVDYLDGGWNPDLIFGERAESEDSFASEVLGPAVARVLIAKMGGELRQEANEGNKIVLVVDVPVKAFVARELKVLLNMQSTPMEMICKSALSDLPVEYLCAETQGNAEVIMMETGMANEGEMVAGLRGQCPKAQIYGIGKPENPALYDFVAEVPLEAAQLKSRVSAVMG